MGGTRTPLYLSLFIFLFKPLHYLLYKDFLTHYKLVEVYKN